jgi:hypothetical protein
MKGSNSSKNFADSVRPEVVLKHGCQCAWKKHFRGCLRQYAGFVDYMAAKDPERFVWASETEIARRCRKYSDGKPEEKPYDKRMARYCKRFLRERGIISEQVTRIRQGVVRQGFIVAAHDFITERHGDSCICASLGSAESSSQSSPQSSVVSSLASSLSSSSTNDLEFRMEFPIEFPSGSPQMPENINTCSRDEKVCCEFAESLPLPNPETLITMYPPNPPTSQTMTVRKKDSAEVRKGLADIFEKARAGKKLNLAGFEKIQALADEVGSDVLLEVWRKWLADRDTGGMKLPLTMFAREFKEKRADMEHGKARADEHASHKRREADSKAIEREWIDGLNQFASETFLSGCTD